MNSKITVTFGTMAIAAAALLFAWRTSIIKDVTTTTDIITNTHTTIITSIVITTTKDIITNTKDTRTTGNKKSARGGSQNCISD
jgi:uncharacterized membrane protein YedE/YeeE